MSISSVPRREPASSPILERFQRCECEPFSDMKVAPVFNATRSDLPNLKISRSSYKELTGDVAVGGQLRTGSRTEPPRGAFRLLAVCFRGAPAPSASHSRLARPAEAAERPSSSTLPPCLRSSRRTSAAGAAASTTRSGDRISPARIPAGTLTILSEPPDFKS